MKFETTKMGRKTPVSCIELLKTFSKNELEGLEKLLSCEYFNTDDKVRKLLKTLNKYIFLRSGEYYNNEMQCIIYKEVFEHLPAPKGALKKNEHDWLNKKLNKLMPLAELFLSIQNLKKSDRHKCDLLYPELLARKQYQSFNNRHITKDKKELKKQVRKGKAYYAQQYKIENAVFNYLHQSGKLIKDEEPNFAELVYNLDMYYILNKLDLYITMLSIRYVPGSEEYDTESMKATMPLELPQYAENPLIILYRAHIALEETASEEAYNILRNELEEYKSVVPVDALKGFYTTLINYCVSQIKRGELDYNRKIFELFKVMDKEELLVDKGVIPAVKLKNLVTVSCQVGEYEWAIDAIERYRPYIRQEIRDSICYYNLGVVAFYQKDYETAHSLFVKVGKVNKVYNINVRVMILKCLYEKEKDYNDYTMQAFRSILKFFEEDKSLPADDKKGYINFIKILIHLYRTRHNINASKADIERIKEKLDAQKVNSDKRWLSEKIKELERKIK